MKQTIIKSLTDYLETIERSRKKDNPITLFRGQSDDKSLLPSICRDNPSIDTTELEIEMLEDFKRRVALKVKTTFKDDWDWLVYAQHYGMYTRLLDWSSNPLTALWFSCSNHYKLNIDSFVYVLSADDSILLNREKDKSPFKQTNTRILRPALNNERIVAQAGWFTSHKYSKTGRFVPLESNPLINGGIIKIMIPNEIKTDLLRSLSIFGINYQTLFPDVAGVSKHLNWKYLKKL